MILRAQRLSAVRARAQARLKAPAAYAYHLSTALPWVHNAASWSSSNSDASSRPSTSSSVVLDEPIASPSIQARVSSFLEDVSDEYGYNAAAEEHRALQQFLSDAVQRGNYAAANSLRERMVDSGFEIMHDVAYAGVAEHFLRLCTTLTGARTKSSSTPSSTFAHAMAWWSLVPPLSFPVTAHTASTSSTYASIRHEILDGLTALLTSPDLPISYARTFALALASKGYMKPIQKSLIARIVSFSKPENIAPFLREVDRWDAAFSVSGTATKNGSFSNTAAEEEDDDARLRLVQGNIRRRSAARWSLAVRTQAFAGRIPESARLLLEFCRSTTGDDKKRMFNFHAVLASARRAGLDEDADVRRVWKVASDVLGRRRYGRLKKLVREDGSRSSSMVKGKEIMPPDPWDVPEGEGYSPQSTDAAELFLSPTLPSTSFPHTASLAAWLASHDELGSRDQADALLDAWVSLDSAHSTPGSSSRAPHNSGRAQSRAAAEMYLALSRDEPERALQVFVRSFRSEGVPGRRILEILTGSEDVGERDFLEAGSVAFSRVSVGGRMAPSRHVVTVLVGAILASLPRPTCRTALRREGLTRAEAAQEIYSDLIRALSPSSSLDASSASSSSSSTSQLLNDSDTPSSPPLIESFPQRMLPSSDSALFTPLLSSPYFSSFPSQHSILSSMHSLKIPLSRQVLTKVVRAAAQEGHAELVKGVINGMGQDVDRVVWLSVMSGLMTGRQWELGMDVLELYRLWETESGRLQREGDDAKTVEALEGVAHRLESAVGLYTAKKNQTVLKNGLGL